MTQERLHWVMKTAVAHCHFHVGFNLDNRALRVMHAALAANPLPALWAAHARRQYEAEFHELQEQNRALLQQQEQQEQLVQTRGFFSSTLFTRPELDVCSFYAQLGGPSGLLVRHCLTPL